MHVIKDNTYLWSVSIKNRTSTEVVLDSEVSGTVDGVETTVFYAQGRIEDGDFTWVSPPSTQTGTLTHPTTSMANVCGA